MKKNWKLTEKVVELIEQTIAPSARVLLDVKLPDLTSNEGATRQCDVVIKNGTPPRETISIVEVQDRNKKVDLTTFDGWCQKMRDVGAQHLICVSKAGFPNSVIAKARRIGPTVRLILFSQLKTGKWPFDFFSNTVANHRRELTKITYTKVNYKSEQNTPAERINIILNQRDFEYNGDKVSVNDLVFRHLDYIELHGGSLDPGINSLQLLLPHKGDKMHFSRDGVRKEIISFRMDFEVEVEHRYRPLTCSTYRQIDFNSELAWLMEAKVSVGGEEKDLRLVFVPDQWNGYTIGARLFTPN